MTFATHFVGLWKLWWCLALVWLSFQLFSSSPGPWTKLIIFKKGLTFKQEAMVISLLSKLFCLGLWYHFCCPNCKKLQSWLISSTFIRYLCFSFLSKVRVLGFQPIYWTSQTLECDPPQTHRMYNPK